TITIIRHLKCTSTRQTRWRRPAGTCSRRSGRCYGRVRRRPEIDDRAKKQADRPAGRNNAGQSGEIMHVRGRVLVTGAGGFIGHHLVRYLVDRGYWVRGADTRYPEYEKSAA